MIGFESKKFINCSGKLLNITEPIVMGILNLTPDSFYDGGKYLDETALKNRIYQIINEGAKIIDIGAYSSRPGAKHIDEKEELNRLKPALEILSDTGKDIIISIDTFRANIAKYAIEKHQVSIINDISSGNFDQAMIEVVKQYNIPYIIMHMQGTPQNMQNNPKYTHLVKEIFYFFAEKLDILKKKGINDVIIDPGFGFGKTIEHNYELLKHLDEFKIFELPILVGLSRKSMIHKYLDVNSSEALNGTTVLNTIALQKGAKILRVHDVKQAVETIKLVKKTFDP